MTMLSGTPCPPRLAGIPFTLNRASQTVGGKSQIGSVEAFGEPVVDVGEHDARLVWAGLLDDKAGEALLLRAAAAPSRPW
jgi:hypothetical protein